MLNEQYIERNVGKLCGLCGRIRELFELPGRPQKFCLECSADLATVIQAYSGCFFCCVSLDVSAVLRPRRPL